MTAHWAYWCRDLGTSQALESPRLARLRRAWPNLADDPDAVWRVQKHPVQGTVLVWPAPTDAMPLDRFGKPRDTHDGLVYFPSLEAPTAEQLIRPEWHRPPGIWVPLSGGGELYVALATATPRQLIMRASGGIDVGAFQDEYGVLAHELFEIYTGKGAGIQMNDPRLARLVFLCLRQSYYVTEELAEDLTWFSTIDLRPIVDGIMGLNPKASAAAPAHSASRGRSTQTSRSHPRKRRPSTKCSRATGSRRRSG